MSFRNGLAAAAVLALAAGAAESTTTTYLISFETGAFNQAQGSDPAPSSVSGSFRLTLDPTQSYAGQAVDAATPGVAVGSAVQFDYPVSYGSGSDGLGLGGAYGGVSLVYFFTDDFYLHIDNFTTAPVFNQFGFTTSAGDYYYTDIGDGSVHVTALSPVPLPASLPLLGAALAWAGLWGRRRRSRSV